MLGLALLVSLPLLRHYFLFGSLLVLAPLNSPLLFFERDDLLAPVRLEACHILESELVAQEGLFPRLFPIALHLRLINVALASALRTFNSCFDQRRRLSRASSLSLGDWSG